jgi:hypothetical protein
MNQNAIFIHAAILNKCKERVLQYLDIIKNSKLNNNVTFIYICFIGSEKIPLSDIDITEYNQNNQIKMIKLSDNLSDYELPTLNFLYTFCLQNSNYNVLYLHTKNVGKETNICIEDQIEYMLYFLISKWEICIKTLVTHDACGVDLRKEPTLHYSGNFWWSRADNIISLPSPIEFNNINKYPNPLNSLRHNQEFWICYNKNNKNYISLWDCKISVYERHLYRYPKELYVSS